MTFSISKDITLVSVVRKESCVEHAHTSLTGLMSVGTSGKTRWI